MELEIGDKIKYRQESFSGKLRGYKVGIVVEIRPYLLTRQHILFCVTGYIDPDGKERQPNFISEVHDLFPHGEGSGVEILEKGCSVDGLETIPYWEKKRQPEKLPESKTMQENIQQQLLLF